MMKLGDTIELLEGVAVTDALGMDYLIKGTRGQITAIDGPLLSMRAKDTEYQGIPLVSVRLVEENGTKAA